MPINIKINLIGFDILTNLVRKDDAFEMSEHARDIIYKRTKFGFGSTAGGERYKLPPLSDLTIKIRRAFAKDRRRKQGKFFSPARSNLTMTGQLLESMHSRRTGEGKAKLVIRKNKRRRSDLTNLALAEKLEARGFRFFGLNVGERRIVINRYRREIERRLQ